MLCWITDLTHRRKRRVNVKTQQTVVVRYKYFSYVELVLSTGETVKPMTITWVKHEATTLPEKTITI